MTYRSGKTRVVLNTTEMSTADFVRHRDANLKADERIRAIGEAVGRQNLATVAANQLAEQLLGNTIYANVLMLGFAWQSGLVPVSREAIRRAIELNGVEVDTNNAAFDWGRLAAADFPALREIIEQPATVAGQPETLDGMIARRVEFLADYQDKALAGRYRQLVDRAREREQTVGTAADPRFTRAVARAGFKTLAYKDEYEVARLHVHTGFLERLEKEYGKSAKVRFHLAPPFLSRGVDARGRPLKREFGAWMIPVFRLLASMRRLRGTKLDPFGLSRERRMERRLIGEFEQTVETLLQNLQPDNIEVATSIVELYLEIRGYGPVKEQAIAEVRPKIERALRDIVNVKRKAA
jgi:indolepyruvate ferredoxin oxidoreductase